MPIFLADLLEVRPTTDALRARRWAAASEAVESVYPSLLGATRVDLIQARTLRVATGAIDLFVFHGAFGALFDDVPVRWSWRLHSGDAPQDAWVEIGTDDLVLLEDGHRFHTEEHGIEYVIHRTHLARAYSDGAPRPGRFDDHDAVGMVDAVVGALGRRMLRLAAMRGTESDSALDGAEEVLRKAFGVGPCRA